MRPAKDPKRQASLVDISREYFNAFIERQVFVELPHEFGYGKDIVGEFVKSMYGILDAV